ncbi:hypothetical protein [Methylomicrobium sp. Wu6]|uniref:carboxypeptidase-like regulatory domain-containing protein n=1 Tax=Methylomicrobium sp. Wu6 TaxID=3107928 RepID=UPI002DD6A05F|nr:hypothetical protein [Methylomicrobium sp. Wu6]MEC4748869.1 hypothetical protein [Methylomicrobium sp. Wu6]
MQIYLIPKRVTRRRMSISITAALALIIGLAPMLASGAEIYGNISRDGVAVSNKPIYVDGKEVGQTDAAGDYSLLLPPGQYKLTIEGKEVPLVVPPQDFKQDIQLH